MDPFTGSEDSHLISVLFSWVVSALRKLLALAVALLLVDTTISTFTQQATLCGGVKGVTELLAFKRWFQFVQTDFIFLSFIPLSSLVSELKRSPQSLMTIDFCFF